MEKKCQNDLDLHDSFINQNFLAFSPRETGWLKARKSLIYENIVQIQIFLHLVRKKPIFLFSMFSPSLTKKKLSYKNRFKRLFALIYFLLQTTTVTVAVRTALTFGPPATPYYAINHNSLRKRVSLALPCCWTLACTASVICCMLSIQYGYCCVFIFLFFFLTFLIVHSAFPMFFYLVNISNMDCKIYKKNWL